MENYFSVSLKNDGENSNLDQIVKENGQIENFFNAHKNGKRACDYIYLKTDDEQFYFFKTDLISFNFDPSKGEPFAAYQIELAADQLKNTQIVQTGFAFDTSKNSVVSSCRVSLFKQSNQRLFVTGGLTLNASDPRGELSPHFGAALTGGGDNALAQFLLGNLTINADDFLIFAGNAAAPLLPINRGLDLMQPTSLKVTIDASPNKITLSTIGELNLSREIVLSYQNKAVARFFAANVEQVNVSIRASVDGSVPLSNQPIDISNVTINGLTQLSFSVFPTAHTLFFVTDLGFKTKRDAEVFSEPNGRFFGLKQGDCDDLCEDLEENSGENLEKREGEIILFKTDENRRLQPYYFGKGRAAAVCRDGSAIVSTSSGFKIVAIRDTYINQEEEFNEQLGDDFAAILLNNHYFLVTKLDGILKFITINNRFELSKVEENFDQNNPPKLLTMGDFVAVLPWQGQIRALNPFSASVQIQNWLNNPIILNHIRQNFETQIYFENRTLCFFDKQTNRSSFAYWLENNVISAAVAGKINDGFLIDGQGIYCVFDQTRDLNIGIGRHGCGKNIKRIFLSSGAAYIFCKCGKVMFFAVSSLNPRLVSSAIRAGDSVRYTVTRGSSSLSKVSICIET